MRALAQVPKDHVQYPSQTPMVGGERDGNNNGMKQQALGLNLSTQCTRRKVLLHEMQQVMPWADLLALISAHAPVAKTVRSPFDLALMLRIHCLQQWFGLSDLGAEEALFETGFYRDFVGIRVTERIPDRGSILRFCHLLEEHDLSPSVIQVINGKLAAHGLLLKIGSVMDATLIAAPSSTKNKDGACDPEMHQVKKGNQWHFGMKAHIDVDADSDTVQLNHAVCARPTSGWPEGSFCRKRRHKCVCKREKPGNNAQKQPMKYANGDDVSSLGMHFFMRRSHFQFWT